MNIQKFFRMKKPEIFLGLGLGGMIMTIYTTAKSAIAAHELKKTLVKENPEITKKDLLKKEVKLFIGPAILFVASTASIGFSYTTMKTRNALLASALASAEAASTKYQKRVVEAIGEDAEKKLREDLNLPQGPENEPTEVSPYDQYPCIETTTGQMFSCSVEDIHAAQETVNDIRLKDVDNTVCLNDFYQELEHLSGSQIRSTDIGDHMGWDIDHPVRVDIDSRIVDGVPTIMLTPRGYVELYSVW